MPCGVTIPAPDRFPSSPPNLPTRVTSCRSRTRRYAMIANAPRRGTHPPRPRKPDSGHTGTISIMLRVCRASLNAMNLWIQCALTPWKPGSTASGPAPAAIHDPAQLQPRSMVGPTPAPMLCRGHFRLSGRSWERRRRVSETGISNTTVASSSGALAFAGAGGFAAPAGALPAAFVPLATVASSGVPPSDHGTAGPHGGLPPAVGVAVGSAARSAPGARAASGARAAARVVACSAERAAAGVASRSRARPRAASRSRPRALPRAGAGAGTGSAV